MTSPARPRLSPTYVTAPGPLHGTVQHRATYGALVAHGVSTSFWKCPEVWTVTRRAPRPETPARVETVTLGALRHGGFARDCRALASVITAGLRGRLEAA